MSKSHISLKIVIVGAGIAGLAAAGRFARLGHRVQVIERRRDISPYGGGIVLQPNIIRILKSWGLESDFLPFVETIEYIVIRRYGDGTVLRAVHRDIPQGRHHWYMRRSTAQKLFYEAAVKQGVDVRFGTSVVSVDPSSPSITLDDGSVLDADLVIGADGASSMVRETLSIPGELERNPGLVFQMSAPHAMMQEDVTTRYLLENKAFRAWVGPGRYGITWSGKEYYDIQLGDEEYGTLHETEPWNQLSDMEYVRRRFKGFAPALDSILSKLEDCYKWKLALLPVLPTWRSENGKAILLGDAAHAMGPYAGQGVCQGIEDAAVLAEFLNACAALSDIPAMTELYQSLRKPRTERIQQMAYQNRDNFILPDGPLQEDRDKRMKLVSSGPGAEVAFARSPDEDWMEGYDAIREARAALKSSRIEAKL